MRLGEALRWADSRSESAWESVLRVLHAVCDVEVRPQHEVYHAGLFIARADLWLVGTQVVHEYDGGEHLKRARPQQDLRRERRLSSSAWLRRSYTSDDVLHRAVTILRDADLSLGTVRLRRRWCLPGATGHRGTRAG